MSDTPILVPDAHSVAAREGFTSEFDQVRATVQALQGAASLLQGALEQRQGLWAEMRGAEEALALTRTQLERTARDLAQVRSEQSGVVAEFDRLVHSALARRGALVSEIAQLEHRRDTLLTAVAPQPTPAAAPEPLQATPALAKPVAATAAPEMAAPILAAPMAQPALAAPVAEPVLSAPMAEPVLAAPTLAAPMAEPVLAAPTLAAPSLAAPMAVVPAAAAVLVEPAAAPVLAAPVAVVVPAPEMAELVAAPMAVVPAAAPVLVEPAAATVLAAHVAVVAAPEMAELVAAPVLAAPMAVVPAAATGLVEPAAAPVLAAPAAELLLAAPMAVTPMAAAPALAVPVAVLAAPLLTAPGAAAVAGRRRRRGLRLPGLGFVFSSLLAMVLIGLAVLLTPVSQLAGGLQLLSVMSGSMEPTIHVGGIVGVHPVLASELQVGDVITFTNPSNPDVMITHRVVGLESRGAQTLLTTKGDANDSPDAMTTSTSRAVGRVEFTLPWLGFLMVWMATPLAKVGILVVSVVGFALPSIKRAPARADAPNQPNEPNEPNETYRALERELQDLLPSAG